MLRIEEHPASGYTARTQANAQGADLTVAFAVDYNTAGERLTRKVAGERYLAVPLSRTPLEAARELYRALRDRNARSLNVAGNGIYTLAQHGWTQEAVSAWVYEVLAKVHEHWPLTAVRSGGQTGVDLAGIVAGHALELDCLALMPKGFVQRGADKIDKCHTADEVAEQVARGVRWLNIQADVASLVGRTLQRAAEQREAAKAGPAPSVAAAPAAPGSVRVVSKRKGGVAAAPGETIIDGDRDDPVFGNPHVLGNHQDDDERARVIRQHLIEDYEPDVLAGGPIYRKMLSLAERVAAGERLAIACWCAPRACHCDQYAQGIEALVRGDDLQAIVRRAIEERDKDDPDVEIQIDFGF